MGAHYGAAMDRARQLNAHYDGLLERLSTPEGRDKHHADMEDEAAAMVVRIRANAQLAQNDKGEWQEAKPMDRNPGIWRDTADKMKAARALPPAQELEALAAHAAFAFGDRSTFDLIGGSEYHAALVDVLEPQRPTDAVDAAMFDAMKTALDARITELAGERLVNPRHTLSHLHAAIAELRKLKPNTVRNHKVTTAKFNKFLLDEKRMDYEPSLASITPDLLQEYLDYLLHDDGVKNSSIHKYFDGMSSVFNHAIKTRKVPGVIMNPVKTLEMPRTDAIEDTMYLPFNDAEMKRIWAEAQWEWDPDNRRSKLSAERRRAFLMVLRVLLWSGLRPVEAFWLRDHGGVTADYIDVQRTKTGIKRKIPICDHIADFPAFVADGGFDACIFEGLHQGEEYGKYNAEKLHEAMRRSFAVIRKRARVTDPRKVLYSTKDTLLQRLRAVDGYSTPIEVVVTGHVKKLEMGRHYGGTLGDDPAMRAAVKKCLDAVTYW
ncbi:site-specific integrase [Thalassovita sp.]|uniref:site-specific integrase n=1 Tax=Thalassovita sp. TaxID=1979401 RepID=UPI002B27A808|nr:site-specific integrase [Thalassovita sp.]